MTDYNKAYEALKQVTSYIEGYKITAMSVIPNSENKNAVMRTINNILEGVSNIEINLQEEADEEIEEMIK